MNQPNDDGWQHPAAGEYSAATVALLTSATPCKCSKFGTSQRPCRGVATCGRSRHHADLLPQSSSAVAAGVSRPHRPHRQRSPLASVTADATEF